MKLISKTTVFAVLLVAMPISGFSAENANDVLSEAKALYKQADKLQGAWISTNKLIQAAEQAIKSGYNESALKLAKKARFEAKRSFEQAQEQLSNWSEPEYLK